MYISLEMAETMPSRVAPEGDYVTATCARDGVLEPHGLQVAEA